jgi:hypothetical protein
LASLGVSLEGRGSSQGDSVGLEPRHCVSEDTLSELDLAHASKCVLGRQQQVNSTLKVPPHWHIVPAKSYSLCTGTFAISSSIIVSKLFPCFFKTI